MRKLLFLTFAILTFVIPTNAKEQLASNVIFLFERQADKEKQPNDSIFCTFKIKHTCNDWYFGTQFPEPILLITIQNNTERPICVDLLNSHVISNGETFPLFTNTTDVTSQGKSVGAGIGLGVIGIASSNTTVNTTMTQEQRFITIPGETRKIMEIPVVRKWNIPWKLNDDCGEFQLIKNEHTTYAYLSHNCLVEGLSTYDGSDTPLNLDFRICYSFNSDMQPSFTNRSVYYTKYVIGIKLVGNEYQKYYKKAQKILPSFDEYLKGSNTLMMNLWGCEKK